MADRVHPLQPPEPTAATTVTQNPPESPVSSSDAFIPKPGPPPGTYVIQVPKDVILRTPPPANASRAKAYARRAARRRGCCCLVLAGLGALIFLLAVAAGVIFLVFRPRAPRYSIDALSVASFNLSDATVSPVFEATVRADNPNKKVGIYYRDGSDVKVSYDGVTLSEGAWPTFYHPPRNVTVFVSELKGAGILLSSDNRRALVKANSEGKVPLGMSIKVPIKVKFGAVRSWTIKVKVNCDVTVDKLTEKAKIVSKDCRVKVKVLGFFGL
ncbi:protein YLS9-like [Canna indica]|uniref:Protein YLS9-like n=1 Tax=Canna indica TaxID=4628 RepID=A0AAQ3L6W2_9LILI|nr:protein YLS9-like [Canna indica]